MPSFGNIGKSAEEVQLAALKALELLKKQSAFTPAVVPEITDKALKQGIKEMADNNLSNEQLQEIANNIFGHMSQYKGLSEKAIDLGGLTKLRPSGQAIMTEGVPQPDTGVLTSDWKPRMAEILNSIHPKMNDAFAKLNSSGVYDVETLGDIEKIYSIDNTASLGASDARRIAELIQFNPKLNNNDIATVTKHLSLYKTQKNTSNDIEVSGFLVNAMNKATPGIKSVMTEMLDTINKAIEKGHFTSPKHLEELKAEQRKVWETYSKNSAIQNRIPKNIQRMNPRTGEMESVINPAWESFTQALRQAERTVTNSRQLNYESLFGYRGSPIPAYKKLFKYSKELEGMGSGAPSFFIETITSGKSPEEAIELTRQLFG
jgi:hypothetical protein